MAVSAQAALFPTREVPRAAAGLATVDRALEGVILRGAGGPWRVRGRDATGAYLVARCDRFGVDVRGARLEPAPRDHPTLATVLRFLPPR